MNVLVFASRKGGSGKSTLAAHLATYIASPTRRTLLIDADPQGSLSFWHKIRGKEIQRSGTASATSPKLSRRRSAMDTNGFSSIRRRTNLSRGGGGHQTGDLVIIPMRPGVFDIAAVQDTVELSRELRKPYAAVINGAPPKRTIRKSRSWPMHAGR